MKSTEHIHRAGSRMNRLMKWPLLCGLLGLAPVALVAGDFAGDTYINGAIVSYPGTETHPPMIDATNFINNGTFTINFTAFSLTQPLYETSDTVNFTNNYAMTANTGFRFDTRYSAGSGQRTMAGSFNNQGTITNGSSFDIFLLNQLNLISLNSFFGFGGYGYCLVNATNIVNPGVVDAGAGGLIQFNGQNVDLSRSTLSIEGSGAYTAGTGILDLNTNKFLGWDPSQYLGATFAESAYFPTAPFILSLPNSTAYFDLPANQSSNNVIRAVFIEDYSVPSVPYNVYFKSVGNELGVGSVTIEWVGSYQDAATGNTYGNYLYLTDDYVQGASTNQIFNNGIPYNYTITASTTQVPLGVPPATAGFVDVFPAGVVTNRYSYANIDLISSSVSTNDLQNLAITNLPGRIEISAANELNLATARITGASYLSVQSPNQFDGSPGALIQAPYADLNVGVTNGFLTVSNLLSPAIPNWSGTIQAWSTRWVTVDAGVTNDYRVLIVGSQLTSTTLSQVQDLILHGTNSIKICDAMNVMRTFTADGQNLTVATNGAGNGATSLNGELNLEISSAFYGSSSLPNLRNLTNNGAIRLQNLAEFVGQTNVYTVTPGTPAASATGTLAEVVIGSNVAANYKVIIGTNQYVFVSSLANGTPNQVKVATKFDGSMSNLIAAINLGAGAGTTYSSSTLLNAQVSAGTLTNHAFTVTARTAGTAGNSIITALSTTAVNLAWTGAVTNHLAGGADFVAGTTNLTSTTSLPYDNFVNRGLLSDQGSTIWTKNFESSGAVSNGFGSFALKSLTTTLTNGTVTAGGDIVVTASSLVTSNMMLQAGKSLTLSPTNLITDGGLTNGNIWFVGGASGVGFSLLVKPPVGDLLGTTVSNTAVASKTVLNTWAAHDFGATTAGYTNNAAVGRLILDAFGDVPQNGVFSFAGTGTSNAMYVDYLELKDSATNRDVSGNAVALSFGPNVVLYYAQAVQNGQSVAEKLNHKNGDHLRWVPTYTGYYSSTNLVYPAGVTNTLNQALVQSTSMDSDGDGTVNAFDTTPVFVAAQVNFGLTVTNLPPLSVRVQWATIPHATNFVYYTTNLAAGVWLPFTNFNQYYYGANVAVTNSAHLNSFVSPQGYPSPATNVWLFDAVTNTPHYYQVVVQPWLTYPF